MYSHLVRMSSILYLRWERRSGRAGRGDGRLFLTGPILDDGTPGSCDSGSPAQVGSAGYGGVGQADAFGMIAPDEAWPRALSPHGASPLVR